MDRFKVGLGVTYFPLHTSTTRLPLTAQALGGADPFYIFTVNK